MSPGTHDVGIYLPAEYYSNPNKTYPVLYLSNGGQGTESDWFQQGRAHSISKFPLEISRFHQFIYLKAD